jgi:hypothetical protein
MIFPIRIYNKAMELVKEIKEAELSQTFWREKGRKKDLNVLENDSGIKNMPKPKEILIICKNPKCRKEVMKKSKRALYCSEKCMREYKKYLGRKTK